MKTTKINVDGKLVIVGILRKYDSTKVMEAPSLIKSFNEENGTNVRLIRPTTADCLLVKTDQWRDITNAFPTPVDTAIAYEKPKQKIGDTVVFSAEGEPRVILATTGNAKGKRDVAILVLDITAEDVKREGNDYVIEVPQSRLVVVPDFPAENGWYRTYENTTVPYGEQVESSSEARYLYRRDDESYVGFLVRDDGYFDGYRGHLIDTGHRPSDVRGLVVEISEGDAEKICGNEQAPRERSSMETPERTVVEILGQSPEQFRKLISEAQESAFQLAGALNRTLFAPIQKVLDQLGEATLKE
jgi:hypothetical protein